MSKCKLFQLAFGPMSTESIEAVFRYSATTSVPLALISSKNQIDYCGGYVNGWTTEDYMRHINTLRESYPSSEVYICRDHCGPGFNGIDNLEDVYNTIISDIYFGFDLIHFDFCHYKGSESDKLYETLRAIEFALKYNPDICIEVGTEENTGIPARDLDRLDKYIDFFLKYCSPDFYVVQTGSKVFEGLQVGGFDRKKVDDASKLLASKGLKLKEHNADYITVKEILARVGVVDALNIAPELGTIQTTLMMSLINSCNVQCGDWHYECVMGGKWRKWMSAKDFSQAKAWMLSGHYHFSGEAYEEVVQQLNKWVDLSEMVIELVMERIDEYVTAFVECEAN